MTRRTTLKKHTFESTAQLNQLHFVQKLLNNWGATVRFLRLKDIKHVLEYCPVIFQISQFNLIKNEIIIIIIIIIIIVIIIVIVIVIVLVVVVVVVVVVRIFLR